MTQKRTHGHHTSSDELIAQAFVGFDKKINDLEKILQNNHALLEFQLEQKSDCTNPLPKF